MRRTCAQSAPAGSAVSGPSAGTAPILEVAPTPIARVFHIRQTTTLQDIDRDAKLVRWWISIPDDGSKQEVLDIRVVHAPGSWRIGHDLTHGNRFLYVEAENPNAESLSAVVEFTIRREPVIIALDPAQATPLTDNHRAFYAEELALDAPNMFVDDHMQELADKVCGEDRNPASQAIKLMQYVASSTDHYSKDPTKPTCGIGSAENCMLNGGGCCTDLHSLFITLARARGIPARLQMGYRLNPNNEGKEYNPGYRCWAEYFISNYGWVPADIVEADAVSGLGPDFWFSGLTEWRVWLNEGREFTLQPKQAGAAVNTMIFGYAEIDGQPARVLPEGDKAAQLSRTIEFVQVKGLTQSK